MTTLAYLRVSTDQQTESGAGLDAQLDACTRAGGELGGVYRDEGISGSAGLEKRPVLLAAIGALDKGDILLVAKRDRLGRDPLVVAMIESAVKRKGARIVSAAGEGTDSDNPSDVLMRRMVDAFAEYERLIIGARTKAALASKKARGERTGSIPYGYRLAADGKQLEADEREQEIVRLVRLLRDGGETYRAIAAELMARGLSPRGKAWNPKTIRSIAEADNARAA
jgi:DNA invertase Pin-like site-specific DNA recombinase